MDNGGIKVVDILRESARDIPDAIRATAGVLGLLALIAAAKHSMLLTGFGGGWVMLVVLAQFAASVAALGALYRWMFGRMAMGSPATAPGPGGFQWGPTETRLAVAALLLVFFYLLVSLFAFVLCIIVAAGATFASGASMTTNPAASAPAMVGVGAVFLVYLGLMVWSGVRLALSSPATAARGQVQVFSTWAMTRRRFWPLFATLLLSLVPAILASVTVSAILAAVRQATGIVGAPLAIGLSVLLVLFTVFIQLPLTVAVLARLYRACDGLGVAEGTIAAPFAAV